MAALLYLVLTSRLLDKQVSAAVKGHSSSGKSHTVQTVTDFFPPAAFVAMTAMSERALIYSKDDYKHRTLVIYEAVALREGVQEDLTSYFVRSLLSEGRIEYPVTVRDKDGGFTTKTIVKEGPTNLILTTTKTKVHAENETRLLSVNTDDSREQTARVLMALADETAKTVDFKGWHALQRWLADANRNVTIPYAKTLAEKVPPVAVRLRRDFGAVLALVRAHAILHQATRDVDDEGRIIATLDDYDVVRDLVADVVAAGVEATVPPTTRETVAVVENLSADAATGITVRQAAEALGLDRSAASRRVRAAAEGGWLRNLEDKRGRPGRWVVGDPMPADADLLPQVVTLHSRTPCNCETAGQRGVCTCARDSEGVYSGTGEPPSDEPAAAEGDATPRCYFCLAPATAIADEGWCVCPDHAHLARKE